MYSYIQSLAVHSAVPCGPLCHALLCTQIVQTAEYLRNPPVARLVSLLNLYVHSTYVSYQLTYYVKVTGVITKYIENSQMSDVRCQVILHNSNKRIYKKDSDNIRDHNSGSNMADVRCQLILRWHGY
jgi:hypothetical protein